jgi:hypothetical protein
MHCLMLLSSQRWFCAHRIGSSGKLMRCKILTNENAAEELTCALGDEHRVGRRQLAQSCSFRSTLGTTRLTISPSFPFVSRAQAIKPCCSCLRAYKRPAGPPIRSQVAQQG